jgi:hypothetical protein
MCYHLSATPPKLLIEMVFLSVFWLNAFPNKQGISRTISLHTIVMGKQIGYRTHCRVEFGQYVQTHEKHNSSMVTRTVGALALRPTDNAQGGYYFYSLATGRRLNWTHWTELPMPDSVHDRVHALAQRVRADKGLTSTGGDGNDLDLRYPEDDGDNDSDYDPDDNDDAVSSDNDSDDGYIAPLPTRWAMQEWITTVQECMMMATTTAQSTMTTQAQVTMREMQEWTT